MDYYDKLHYIDQENEKYSELFKMLTQKIIQCRTPSDLFLILDQEWKHMNHINVAAAATKAAHVCNSVHVRKFKKEFQVSEGMYKKLLIVIEMYMEGMSDRSIANCIWSLGKGAEIFQFHTNNNQKFELVYEELCKRAFKNRKYLQIQDFSNIIWSMAKLNWTKDDILMRFLNHTLNSKQLQQVDDPRQISNILWAIATTDYQKLIYLKKTQEQQHFKLQGDLNEQIRNLLELTDYQQDVNNLKDFDHQSITNVLWALRKLRFLSVDFMIAAEEVICSGEWNFTTQDVGCIALTLADFGVRNPKALSYLMYQFQKNFNGVDVQGALNLVYSMAVMQVPFLQTQQVLNTLFLQINLQNQPLNNYQLRQIGRAILQYKSTCNTILHVPKNIAKLAEYSMIKRMKQRRKVDNKYVNVVFEVLKVEFPSARKRIYALGGVLEIKIEIIKQDCKIAVEVLSYGMMTVNEPKTVLGTTSAHLRCLQGHGWQVVEVAFYKWQNKNYQTGIIQQIQKMLRENKI